MLKGWWWCAIGLVVGLVSGCAALPATSGLRLVASMYPLAFLLTTIAGSDAEVTTLVPAGTEPHDYEPTPTQVASLSTAALVVYQAGVSAAVDQAVGESGASSIDTGTLIQELALNGTTGDPSEDAYGKDPHTWLSPANMAVFADSIADALATTDPADAADFRANAANLKAQLADLDAAYQAGLTGCQRTTFMTTHAAFGYLAKEFGLTQLAIAGVTPEDEPSPRRLAELATQATQLGLTTIFFETLVSPDYATTLADDLGLRTDVLDPIEAITAASRGTDYLQIMRSNLTALRTANGCP